MEVNNTKMNGPNFNFQTINLNILVIYLVFLFIFSFLLFKVKAGLFYSVVINVR